jgi:RNA polymerase sigma-70 factor (ECF subfamily)
MRQHAPTQDPSATRSLPDPEEWVERYADALYRYALRRLRHSHEAEEAVQDTLLTAFKARKQFQGKSLPLTWLIGILRRKILDRLRAAARQAADTDPADLDALFTDAGHWRKAPKKWGDPAAFAERAEFWRVVRGCLARLPARMGEAFTLRTIEEYRADDVCRELAISPANLWVLLHRARLFLVRCLETHWFNTRH